MDQGDERDRVVPIENGPPSGVEAPIPFVLAEESRLIFAYQVQESSPGWEGKRVRAEQERRGSRSDSLQPWLGTHVWSAE